MDSHIGLGKGWVDKPKEARCAGPTEIGMIESNWNVREQVGQEGQVGRGRLDKWGGSG